MSLEPEPIKIHSIEDAAKHESAVYSAARRNSDNPLIEKALKDYEAIRDEYMAIKVHYDRALTRLTNSLKLIDDDGMVFKKTKLDILRQKVKEREERMQERRLRNFQNELK